MYIMCCFHSVQSLKGLHTLALMQPCVSFRCATTTTITTTPKHTPSLSVWHTFTAFDCRLLFGLISVWFVKNSPGSSNSATRLLWAENHNIQVLFCSWQKQFGLLHFDFGGAAVSVSSVRYQATAGSDSVRQCGGICQGRTTGMMQWEITNVRITHTHTHMLADVELCVFFYCSPAGYQENKTPTGRQRCLVKFVTATRCKL